MRVLRDRIRLPREAALVHLHVMARDQDAVRRHDRLVVRVEPAETVRWKLDETYGLSVKKHDFDPPVRIHDFHHFIKNVFS